jgi:zinc-binding in reverse transcriptase
MGIIKNYHDKKWTLQFLDALYNSINTWLSHGGLINNQFKSTWLAGIPLKIKVFLWLVKQNKILTKDNLLKKVW